MRFSFHRFLIAAGFALATLAALPATGMAANVELLKGPVKAVGHDASGRAAVIQIDGRQRVLTLRNFSIDPGPRVLVYLVPRSARGDANITKDFKSLGKLKGNRGNQRYNIPGNLNLNRYRSVVFWCVPFTQVLARADLSRS